MPNEKTHVYTITVRPTHGITPDAVDRIRTLILDLSNQHHIITEPNPAKPGRHLHAWVVYKKPYTSSNHNRDVKKLYYAAIQAEHGASAVHVKQAYNNYWRETYLVKDPGLEIVSSHITGTDEDEAFIAAEYAKIPEPNSKKRVHNQRYIRIAKDIAERMLPPSHGGESFPRTYQAVEHYLMKLFFEGREDYIHDPRKMCREIKAILAFVNYRVDAKNCLDYDYDNIAPKNKKRKL